jgi:hypothetical protein
MFKPKLPSISFYIAIFYCLYSCTMALTGCKRADPAPIDLGLTNPYCNNPTAVNYNWGFPGKPDNSICIFPAQIFVGTYLFKDSVLDNLGIYLPFDSSILTITKTNDSLVKINGQCKNSLQLNAKVNKNYRLILDSIQYNGQVFCNNTDTINGYIQKLNPFDSILTYNYNVINATTTIIHKGTLIKQ